MLDGYKKQMDGWMDIKNVWMDGWIKQIVWWL